MIVNIKIIFWICEIKSISNLYMETACWNSLEPRTHIIKASLLSFLPTQDTLLGYIIFSREKSFPTEVPLLGIIIQKHTVHNTIYSCDCQSHHNLFSWYLRVGFNSFGSWISYSHFPFGSMSKGTWKGMSYLSTKDFFWDATSESKLPSFPSAQNK